MKWHGINIRSSIKHLINDFTLAVWQFLIQSPNLMYANSCVLWVLDAIYTQYCPDRQTKCSSICLALQFAKLNVHQMYCIYMRYGSYSNYLIQSIPPCLIMLTLTLSFKLYFCNANNTYSIVFGYSCWVWLIVVVQENFEMINFYKLFCATKDYAP